MYGYDRCKPGLGRGALERGGGVEGELKYITQKTELEP